MYGKYSEMYSQWCDYYDLDGVELDIISKYVEITDKDVIDIGCGTGRFVFRLLPYVKSVTGVDNDKFSIDVLNDILLRKYEQYVYKTKIICSGIENTLIPSESIDIAFFSWSLYALNRTQMEQAILKVFNMLRVKGKLVILQPIGGEFETVMRLFFKEHEDEDEYKDCIKNMNEIVPRFFDSVAMDKIVSHFIIPDLDKFCGMIQMFAVTEGGCESNALKHISMDILGKRMSSFKQKKGFCLEDEVLLFVYKKKEVKYNGYS